MNYNYITSRANQFVTLVSSLKEKKYRDINGLYICEGKKLCEESIGKSNIKFAIVCESNKQDSLLNIAAKTNAEIYLFSKNVYDKVSIDPASDGIIFIIEKENKDLCIDKDDKVIFLDSLQDPGNLGTVLRSAVAFGFTKIVLYNSVDLYNPKVVKSSMGAIFNINVLQIKDYTSIIDVFKSQFRKLYAATLSTNSISIDQVNKKSSDVIIIGNEGHGISSELIEICDNTVIIPISVYSESLNASIAASIFMWEYSKKNIACGAV